MFTSKFIHLHGTWLPKTKYFGCKIGIQCYNTPLPVEQNNYTTCVRSISNKFYYVKTEKVSLKGNVYDFSVDYDPINKLKKKTFTSIEIMLWIIKQVFIMLLSFGGSLVIKYV